MRIELFLNHMKWKEYVKDEKFLFAFLRYLNCNQEFNGSFFIKHFHIHECMNYSIIKQAVEINGDIMPYLHSKWQQDVSIVKAAIASHPSSFSCMSKNFQKDREMVLYCAKHCHNISDFPKEIIGNFENDPIFVKQVLQLACKRRYIPRRIASLYNCIKNDSDCVWDDTKLNVGCRADVEFVKKCLQDKSIRYAVLSDKWRDQEEILREAILIDSFALEHASTQFLANKFIVLEAVGAHGKVLEAVESPLNLDKEVVETAVKQSPNAIYFANKSIFKDKEFIAHLAKSYPSNMMQFMLDMMPLEVLPEAVQDRLQTLESVLYAALKQDIHVVNCLPYPWEILKMTVIGKESFMKLFCDFYEIPASIIEQNKTINSFKNHAKRSRENGDF